MNLHWSIFVSSFTVCHVEGGGVQSAEEKLELYSADLNSQITKHACLHVAQNWGGGGGGGGAQP